MAKKKSQKNPVPSQLDVRQVNTSNAPAQLEPKSLADGLSSFDFDIEVAIGPDTVEVTDELKLAQQKLQRQISDLPAAKASLRSLSNLEAANGIERVVGTGIGFRSVDGIPTGEPAIKVFIDVEQCVQARISEEIRMDFQLVQVLKIHLQGFTNRFQRPVVAVRSATSCRRSIRFPLSRVGGHAGSTCQ